VYDSEDVGEESPAAIMELLKFLPAMLRGAVDRIMFIPMKIAVSQVQYPR
jgi:hypothetical protein